MTDREVTPLLTELGSRLYANRRLEEDIFDAILSDHPSRSDFSWSTHLAETVMMGTLAERVPGKVLTPADMRAFVAPCRKGWEF